METWTDWLFAAAVTLAPPNAPPAAGPVAYLTAQAARHLSPAGRADLYRWNFLEDPEGTCGYVRRWRAAGLIGDREALDLTAGLYLFGGGPAWHVTALEERLCVCGSGLDTAPYQFVLGRAYLAGGRAADGLALLAHLGTARIDPPDPADGKRGEVDRETALRARQTLAEHHFGRGEWRKALHWYEESGGTGPDFAAAAWDAHRGRQIAACKKALGQPAE